MLLIIPCYHELHHKFVPGEDTVDQNSCKSNQLFLFKSMSFQLFYS